jgi:hypothetical protein
MHGKVLKPEKFSDSITNLVCAECGEIIAIWETDVTKRKTISEEKLKEWV